MPSNSCSNYICEEEYELGLKEAQSSREELQAALVEQNERVQSAEARLEMIETAMCQIGNIAVLSA